MRCPGAPNAEAGILDGAGWYAAEGTFFHNVAADALITGLDAYDFLGTQERVDGFDFEWTEEMADHLQPALDRIAELSFGDWTKIYVEKKVDISAYTIPGQFGTSDVGIIDPILHEITVWDHKYGAGVPVSPVENEQAKLYGLGFWDTIARDIFKNDDPADIKVRLVIHQPRIATGGGEWVTTMADLLAFGEKAREAAQRTLPRNAPRIPGLKQCEFCKASGKCPDLAKFNLEMAGLDFENLDGDPAEVPDLPVPNAFSPERRSYIVRHAALFQKWMDAIHADVLTDALQGRPTPGLKAVLGRQGNRTWSNPEAVAPILEKALRDDAFTRKLISPAQAQKKLPGEVWSDVKKSITRPDGKPSIVTDDDPRPAIEPASAAFENLDADSDLI